MVERLFPAWCSRPVLVVLLAAALSSSGLMAQPGPPQLEASKIDALLADNDGDTVPSPGDAIRYEITIQNSGEQPATGVVLLDHAPAHTTVVPGSVVASQGTVISEAPVEVSLGEVSAGAGAVVFFDVIIDSPVPAGVTEIVNQGTVTSAELPAVLTDDPAVGGSADPTQTMVSAAPILLAEKTDGLAVDADGDGEPSPGDTVQYTVTLRNLGNTSATSVAFDDPIPAHTTLVPGSVGTTQGAVDSEDPVGVTVGEIAGGGGTVTITFRVVIVNPVPAGVDQIANQGAVSSAELPGVLTDDPDIGGAADPTLTPVTAAPILAMAKTDVLFADADGDGVASPGDELLYEISVDNSGNTSATGVSLTDPIPASTAVVAGSVQASQGVVITEDPVEVDLGEVVPGTPAVVSFRVAVASPFPSSVTTVLNQAAVASAELPLLLSDDPDMPGPADVTATPVFITPQLSIDSVTVAEATPEAVFTVALSEPSNRQVTVDWATADGSAVGGLDYVPSAGTLLLPAGSTSASVRVEVLDDALYELSEGFTVELFNPVGVQLAVAQGSGTIVDDDPRPTLFIDDVTVLEGHAGIFTLSLSGPSGLQVGVDYSTVDGTATAAADYVAGAGTLVIPAGSLSTTVSVAVVDDLLDEPDETFFVHLVNPVHADLGGAPGRGTIVDDDAPPELSIDDVSVSEGDAGTTDAVFTLSLSAPSGFDVTVDYATVDDTALAGVDYQATAGTVVVPAGGSSASVVVAVLGDLSDEPDEMFHLSLSNPVHAILADGSGLGSILDDDEVEIAIDDVTVTEGDSGTVDARFTVTLSSPSAMAVSVDFATADGSATAGEDYQATSGTLTLAPGETSADLVVPAFGDLTLEPDETFSVELSNPLGGALVDGQGVGTILNNELCPGPNLLRNPGAEQALAGGEFPGWTETAGADWQQRFAEPPPHQGQAYFFAGTAPVAELRQDVDVAAYAAEIDGGHQLFSFQAFVRTGEEVPTDTARLVVEYLDAADTVLDVFDSGEIASPATWQEVSDAREVPPGTRRLRLRLLATSLGADADNDAYFDSLSLRSLGTAVLSAGDVMVEEGDVGVTPALFEIRLSCALPTDVTVTAATADGTALAGEDYETYGPEGVTLPAGVTTAPVTVTVYGDLTVEPDELFTLELSDPLEAILADPQGLGLILNDDDDTDLDGVPDELDVCPDTRIPERVPMRELRPNRYALVDEDTVFDTLRLGKRPPQDTRPFTVEDTAGCSCYQIILGLDLGKGHWKFGCSLGAMREWVELVNP